MGSLKRRVHRLERAAKRNTSDSADGDGWPPSPERQAERGYGYFLSFLQSSFVFGAFYDLGRYFGYVLCSSTRADPEEQEEVRAVLLAQTRDWIRRFKPTPEQAEEALEAAHRGFEDRFQTKEEWKEYWWGGPGPGSRGRIAPSSFRFRKWIKTNPPRWETAVALDLSRMDPESKRHEPNYPANRLYRDIEAVDAHFHGPRYREHQATLDALRKNLSLEEARAIGKEAARNPPRI
jgi:hypothetical protein